MGVCAAGIALAVATAPVAPASAVASASSCPAAGEGGPFLRICSREVFKIAPTGIGASAAIALPCTKRDLFQRTVYAKGVKGLTVDEGYAYFAVYVPGPPSDEMEVGFFHNANIKGDVYTLYVRHEGFWNSDRTMACNSQVGLQVLVAYGSDGDIGVEVQGNPVNAPVDYIYTFSSSRTRPR